MVYPVSPKFHEAFRADSREMFARITINNKVYTNNNLASFNYEGGSIVGEQFTIGSAFSNSVRIIFCEIVEGLQELDEVEVEIGIKLLDETIEYCPMGIFLISERADHDRNENRTTIECMDRMILLEGLYESELNYPAEAREVALEIANHAGVEIDSESFAQLSPALIQEPIGYTHRQALGLIAQLEAGFVLFNRNGLLAIRQLQSVDFNITPNEYFQAGFVKNELIYQLGGIRSIIRSELEENVMHVGSLTGAQIILENSIMTPSLLEGVFNRLQHLNYFPFTLDWRGNPALEAGDWVVIYDREGNPFKSPNLSYRLVFNGGLRAVSSADTQSQPIATYRQRSRTEQEVSWLNSAVVGRPGEIEDFKAEGLFQTINVSWQSQQLGVQFELHASETSGFEPSEINNIYRGGVPMFNHVSDANITWYYRVRARTQAKFGPWSEEISAQTATFDLSDLEDALEELERDLQDLEQELDDLNTNILPNVQNDLEDLNDRLQGIEDLDIGTIAGDFENRITDNEEALDDLNNNVLPSLQDDLDDLHNNVLPNLREDLEREIEDLNTNLDNLNDTVIPNLNGQLGDLNRDLDDLHENVLPSINDSLTDLNTDLADLNTALDDLANSIPDDVDLSNIYSRLAGLELGLNNLNNTVLPQINADLNQLHNTTLPNLQAQLNTLNNTTIPALNTRLTTNEGAINTLNNTTLPDLREDLAELDELTDSWRWENTVEIDGGAIRANTIHANRITAGTITSTQIGANQITANEIATGTITANEIATNTITANEIATNAIVTRHISTNSVTANEIAVGTITAQEIASSTITGDRLVANTINSREINANAITTNELASGSVTADNIVAGTITGDRLAANSITARELLLTNTSNLAHASEHLPTPVGGGTIVNADGHPWIQFGNATVSGWHNILIMNTPQAMFHQGQHYRIEAIVRRVGGATNLLRVDVSNTFTTGGTQYVSGAVGMLVDQPISETESLITWNLQINHNPDPARTLTGSRMRMVVSNNTGLIQVRNIRVFRRNDANLVVDGSITANSIASGSITTNHMNAGSINGDRITVNTLNANRITAESITSDRIGANQITAINIATDAIQTRHLSTNSITANSIASGSITTNHMTANTINGDRIQTNTLNANRITAGSITTDRMSANSINGDRIQANTLHANRITANSITGDRLQANSITTRELVITDFTNLASLTRTTVSSGQTPGWTIVEDGTGIESNPWFQRDGSRDVQMLSEFMPCRTGERFRVTYEIDTRGLQGMITSGGTVAVNATMGIRFHVRRHNQGLTWPFVMAPANALTQMSGVLEIPEGATEFQIGIGSSQHNPFSGTFRIRNVRVVRMANAELIVDGSITANSIASGSITTNHMTVGTINGDRIQTNTLNANRITAGSITTDRMSANSINGDRIQANTLHANRIQADTLTANMITAGTMHGDRIQAGTLNANRITAGTMSGDRIQGGTISGTTFHTTGAGSTIHIHQGQLDVQDGQNRVRSRLNSVGLDYFDVNGDRVARLNTTEMEGAQTGLALIGENGAGVAFGARMHHSPSVHGTIFRVDGTTGIATLFNGNLGNSMDVNGLQLRNGGMLQGNWSVHPNNALAVRNLATTGWETTSQIGLRQLSVRSSIGAVGTTVNAVGINFGVDRPWSASNSGGLVVNSSGDVGIQFRGQQTWFDVLTPELVDGTQGVIRLGRIQIMWRTMAFPTGSGTTNVQFTYGLNGFSSAPVVIPIQTNQINPHLSSVSVSSVTTTGFQLNLNRTTSLTVSVRWVAIGRAPNPS